MFAGKPFTPPARTRGQKRNFPKANQKRETGVVKFYNDEKGFGFIKREGGKDLFVHINRVKKSKYQGLEKGDQVDFVVGKGYQGPEAQSVTVLNRVQNRKKVDREQNRKRF
ncbi:MAG: hypothetical protein B6I30_06610 [Desulfobacteraceae bacterium 4572_187]|nr:MAG: hypothetical protein B6I30_06610 [Desulfobacteraceae bacterium 4572_187]